MTIKQLLEILPTKEKKLEYINQIFDTLAINLSISISLGMYERKEEIYKLIDQVKLMKEEIQKGE